MQGNCSEAPTDELWAKHVTDSAPSPRTVLPGQCVIFGTALPFSIQDSSLWVDNIYLRVGDSALFENWQSGTSSRLWMTNVTVQGNGATDETRCSAECAANAVEGSQYLEGAAEATGAFASG